MSDPNYPDPDGNTLEDCQAMWDAWPDDGSQCPIGEKPPRPTADADLPPGMTRSEFFNQADPADPEPAS